MNAVSSVSLSPADITAIAAAIVAGGGTVWRATDDLNLFGIRSPWADAEGAPLPIDTWNDAIGWFATQSQASGGGVQGRLYRATTDPGRPILEKPTRKEGAFCLGYGPHVGLWVPGLHFDRPALVQAPGAEAWGYRDGNRNLALDPDISRRRLGYGIHLHNRGTSDPLHVGHASDGCQVTWNKGDVTPILAAVERQRAAGHGATVSYQLLEVSRTPAIAPILARVAA